MRTGDSEVRVPTPVATPVVHGPPSTSKRAAKKSLKPKSKKAKKASKPTAKRASKPRAKKAPRVKTPKVKAPKVKAPKATASKVTNKAQFVRDNPNLSTKELIAKAKVGGAKLTDSYVYNVRGEAKRGRRTTTGPGRLAVPSKAFFVRSLPDLPVREVIARAKELGVTLSESYVYNVRTTENAKAKRGLARGASNGSHEPSATSPAPGPMRINDLFLMVVAELGVAQSAVLLQSIRDTVKSALGRLP